MKCISLWEPWATLWLTEGVKRFETRSWYTSHRGPLLVHAAKSTKGRESCEDPDIIHGLIDAGIRSWNEFNLGCIIGAVDIIGCCKAENVPPQLATPWEQAFGDWTPGRFVWERANNPERFIHPIPFKGAQGFFDVPNDLLIRAGLHLEVIR